MVGFIKPHHPFDPPEPYISLYDPQQLELLPGYTETVHEPEAMHRGYFDHQRLTAEALRRVMAMYYATITQIDDSVGIMIDRSQKASNQDVLRELQQLLTDEVLFKAPSLVHLDEKAPLAPGMVQEELDIRRQQVQNWHKKRTGIAPG